MKDMGGTTYEGVKDDLQKSQTSPDDFLRNSEAVNKEIEEEEKKRRKGLNR